MGASSRLAYSGSITRRAKPSTQSERVDVQIHFMRAEGIPSMDLWSPSDAFIVADLDGKIKYTSRVVWDSACPQWNEQWNVRDVPSQAKLRVQIWDKDDRAFDADDFIGEYTLDHLRTFQGPVQVDTVKGTPATLWLEVHIQAAASGAGGHYIFDGPMRFDCHSSSLTRWLDRREHSYSACSVRLRNVERFFKPGEVSLWAPTAHQEGPTSALAAEAHKTLYSPKHVSSHGTLQSAANFLSMLRYTTYTYVLCAEDSVLRFSETSTSFFKDKMSKHAVHASGSHSVRCAGEFHLQPRGGWDPHRQYSSRTHVNPEEWILVLDNESGTYQPKRAAVDRLARLLEHNFEGLTVTTMEWGSQVLKQSKDMCRWYGRG